MKNIQPILYLLAALCLLAVSSCQQEDPIMFNTKNAYVAFNTGSYSIRESSTSILKIPVGASNLPGQPLTVNFDITVDDASGYRQAVEGVDYTLLNASHTLSFTTGVGYDTIRIQPIDNGVKDAHSTLRIKLATASLPYAIGFNGERTYADVLIYDDESMSKYEGEWKVESKSAIIYVNGVRKETADTSLNNTIPIDKYNVTIVSHPTELNTLVVRNLFNTPTLEVKMIVDEVNGTLTLAVGQIGFINGKPVYIDSFTDVSSVEFSQPVQGTIIDDNTLKVYRYAALLFASGQYYLIHDSYYVLKSTWTRVGQ